MHRSVIIVALCVAIQIMNNGMILAGLTTFDVFLLQDLQVPVAALKARDTITLLTLGATVPFLGYLFDRASVRPIIVFGLVLIAGSFFAYGSIESVGQIYIIHVVLGLAQAACGIVSSVVIVSRWTTRHRGLALGLVVAGSSLGNAIIPPINAWLLRFYDWHQILTFSAAAPLLLIPFVYLVIQERPPVAEDAVVATGPQGNVLRTRHFWFLSGTAFTSVFCVIGLTTSLALYVQKNLGGTVEEAGAMLFMLFGGAVMAQIASGVAVDRFGPARVHFVVLTLMALASVSLTLVPVGVMPMVILAFGMGWGGNSALLQIRPVSLFPGQGLGRALGGLTVFETVGGSLAPVATGYVYDVTGSFTTAFWLLGVMSIMAVVFAAFIGTPLKARSA